MASYTPLSALTTHSDTHTLLVRVSRIWEAINRNNNTVLHTNIILLDEEDNHMLAIVRNNQKDLFLPQLEEGGVYSISNTKVVPGPQLYRAVDRDLSINLFYKTKIQKRQDSRVIPHYKFELQDFASANAMIDKNKCLIDVIGLVTSYGQLEKRARGAQKMDVVISNIRNEEMIVTLWEQRAIQFREALSSTKDPALFVVITGLLAKKFSAKVTLSSTDATRTYFNIDYGPVNDLKTALTTASGKTIELLPAPTVRDFVTTGADIQLDLSIQKIMEATIPTGKDVVRCVCKAKIIEVLNGNGWFYICCPKCARTVRPIQGNYYCGFCAQPATPVAQRYRLVIRVEDYSGTTTLTLFNKEAEQLVGLPLEKLLAEQNEAEANTNIPPPIKNIVGKICTFQIKVTPYNISHGCEEYTVTRVSEVGAVREDLAGADLTGDGSKRRKIA